jgi:hypothetical protein
VKDVNIRFKEETCHHAGSAVNAPGQYALQRETHIPCIEPGRERSFSQAFTHEMLDGIFDGYYIIAEAEEHTAYRKIGENSSHSYDPIRL